MSKWQWTAIRVENIVEITFTNELNMPQSFLISGSTRIASGQRQDNDFKLSLIVGGATVNPGGEVKLVLELPQSYDAYPNAAWLKLELVFGGTFSIPLNPSVD